MANGRNKHQSRENRAKVREVLMEEWDPIGVRGCEGAEDEYDQYAGKAYVMLMDEAATEQAIAAYLFDTATRHMGLSPSPRIAESSARTAAILVGLRPQFELH